MNLCKKYLEKKTEKSAQTHVSVELECFLWDCLLLATRMERRMLRLNTCYTAGFFSA